MLRSSLIGHVTYLLLFAAVPVVAQDSPELEEILVTARKKSESILEAPIAISAFSEAQIESAGFQNLGDLSKAVPGLFMEPTNSFNARINTVPRIRGVFLGTGDRLHQTVSVFVDGIPMPDGFASLGLNGLERVEVIKGPQSALFGRNSFAGAINLVTTDPADTFALQGNVTAATREQYEVVMGVEGPIFADVVRGRIDARMNDTKGHYQNSAVPDQQLGDQKDWSVSGLATITPTEKFTLKLRAFYTEVDDGQPATTLAYGISSHNFGGFPIVDGVADVNAPYDGPSNRVNETESTYKGVLKAPRTIGINSGGGTVRDLQADFLSDPRALTSPLMDRTYNPLNVDEFGLKRKAYSLSAVGMYSFTESTRLSVSIGYNDEAYGYWDDFDMSPDVSWTSFNAADTDDYSLEMRLASTALNGRLDWTVGASLSDIHVIEKGGFANQYLMALGWLDDAYTTAPNDRGAKTAGVFGSLAYQLSDKWSMTVEGRYQEEELRQKGINAALLNPISPASLTNFLPRVVVQYEPSADTSLYFNVSKGNLAGGFNQGVGLLTPEQLAELRAKVPGADVTYDEETLFNYEFGWKQVFMANRASFNAAVFYMERSDELVNFNQSVSNPPGVVPDQRVVTFSSNGATTDIYGVELEGAWQATNNLYLSGSFSYIDSSIASYPAGASTGDFGDIFGRQADVVGQEAPRFPPLLASLAAQYERSIALGGFDNWYVRGDVFYQSGYWKSNANLSEAPEAIDSNLRLGLKSADFGVEIFVTNLFDEDAPQSVFDAADVSLDVRTMPGGYFDFTREAAYMQLRPKRQVGVRFSFAY